MLQNILFLIVVFLSNVIQCITGFAGTVLAMPFSIMLVGFDTAKPILNVLGIAASIGVVAQNRKAIQWKEFGIILGVTLPGMLLGALLRARLAAYDSVLYKTLGVIVIAFALMNFISLLTQKNLVDRAQALGFALLALGGVVHGMFVCGGPLIVTYASVRLKENDQFRATLSTVWIVLNTLLMIGDLRAGYFVKETNLLLLVCLALLVLSILLGNAIAKKLSRKVFLILTDTLMVISGISLLVK